MQDVTNTPKLLLLSAAIAAISACSDGGSSSGSGPVDGSITEPTTQSLSGNAVKGVMASAVVTATSLDGSQSYGTTQTAADGTYALSELALGSGPVLLELTTDSDTQLTCDSAVGCTFNGTTHAFGTKFTFNDPDFTLTSVLPGIADTTAEARLMITPVTHMAAQRVAASGATTTAEIEGVNRATARLVGLANVDITTMTPSDITAAAAADESDAARRYGALVAAFATLAESSGSDISDIIDAISDDFAQDGSMKANSTVAGEISLANIYTAAEDSADKATQSGINLGNVAASLSLDAMLASTAPADSQVTPNDEEATPAQLLTEEEATEAGIALLTDMNNWYQALKNSEVEAKGDMYEAQLRAAAELLPTFSDTAAEIQNWQTLVVNEEEVCVSSYEDWDPETGPYEVCEEYGMSSVPGPLFDAIPVAIKLGQLANYIEDNHENLSYTDNGNGTFTISTNSIGDDLYDNLAVYELLEDDLPNAQVITTYEWTAGEISNVTMYGTGRELVISNSTVPVQLNIGQDEETVTVSLSNLKLTPVTPESSDFTEINLTSAGVSLNFSSEADASAFMAATDNGDAFDPATVARVVAAVSGDISGDTGTASFDYVPSLCLSLNQNVRWLLKWP